MAHFGCRSAYCVGPPGHACQQRVSSVSARRSAPAGAATRKPAGAHTVSATATASDSSERRQASVNELLRGVLQRRAQRLQQQQQQVQVEQAVATVTLQDAAPLPSSSSALPSLQQQPAVQQQLQPAAADWLQEQVAVTSSNGAGAELLPIAANPLPEEAVVGLADVTFEEALSQTRLVPILFDLKYQAEWGQRLKVVGSHKALGEWAVQNAPELQWAQDDHWQATVQLPAGSVAEYKYVVLDHSGNHAVAWQPGNNSVLAVRFTDDKVEVQDNWTGSPGAKVIAAGEQPTTRETRLMSWTNEVVVQLAAQRQDLRRGRIELAAAQEEAREARAEVKSYQSQLAAKEAERAEAVAELAHARAMNAALQEQLANTTASLQEALEAAAELLKQVDGGEEDATPRTRRRKRASSRAAAAEAVAAEAEAPVPVSVEA